MLKHHQITKSRLEKTLHRISQFIFSTPRRPLGVDAYQVEGEPIPASLALAKNYSPFAVGQAWGPAWGTTWFRFTGEIPPEWRGREVVALVQLGTRTDVQEGFSAEGLVWQEGRPTRALNRNRQDVPLARPAQGGETVRFHVEAAANVRAAQPVNADGWFHVLTDTRTIAANKDALLMPEPGGPTHFVLEQAEMACVDREAYALYFDFKVALETMLALPEESPRRGELFYALNESANRLDPADPATVPAARAALREVLARKNGDTVHRISAIGHSHLDSAWLWPLREGIRKFARTCATALAYMEEYPEYVFSCSAGLHYAWLKRHYPSLFADIKAAVHRGQWEPIGSMWVEPDCNLASGESLVRQILHGKNFFLEEFGVETTDLWLPDVFGYAAALPQILHQAGIKYFLTHKIAWNQTNKFPHQTFLWEGLDGTRVFTHFPPSEIYNGTMEPAELLKGVRNFRETDRAARSLYTYGHGDGGGGPTKDALELARRVKNFEGLPTVELDTVAGFFRKAESDARDLPVWVGELYLELHRGTYTTQARNKRANRQCEYLLRDAELFDVLTRSSGLGAAAASQQIPTPLPAVYEVVGQMPPDRTDATAHALNRAWQLLLLNQFHDIIPGSSIHWVYEDSMRDYAVLRDLATPLVTGGAQSLASRIDTSVARRPCVVFNTLGHARNEVITLPGGALAHVEVPPCGYAVAEADAPAACPHPAVTAGTGDNGIVIANGLVRLVIDGDGLLASVRDLRADREVLAPGQRGNVFRLHLDYPNAWDAWDVDIFYRETVQEITIAQSVRLVETGPLRATVEVVRAFGRSRITQRIVLHAGSPRIDFITEVDWHEDHRLLKVAFPVNVHSTRATYEIQYGHTERPTHYNTSWDLARFEVCAHKWADLSEAGFGVALLNDCKYGHDIHGNVMCLSLLRAPMGPDPQADRGRHEFTYALLPHAGDLPASGVIEEAYALNVPLRIEPVTRHAGPWPARQSFFSVDRPGVVVEAVKRAEKEDAIIVRLYEAHGGRGPVSLRTSLPVRQFFKTDLLERSLAPLVQADQGAVRIDISPFEIVTLKLVLHPHDAAPAQGQ